MLLGLALAEGATAALGVELATAGALLEAAASVLPPLALIAAPSDQAANNSPWAIVAEGSLPLPSSTSGLPVAAKKTAPSRRHTLPPVKTDPPSIGQAFSFQVPCPNF